jgi:hypothetical protein
MSNDQSINSKWRLIIPALFLMTVFILAGIIPFGSLWGFNHLKYFPGYVSIIYAVIVLFFIIPYIAEKAGAILSRLTGDFQKMPLVVRIIVIALMAGIIFYIFRVHVHSLGDGYQRIYQIEKGYMYYHTEPLDFFLHAIFFRGLKIFGVISGEMTYTIISVAAGIVFILMVYLFKFPEQITSNSAVLIKLLTISMGGMQMFFGYVESYTFFYLFSLLFLLWASRFMVTNQGLATASLLLALAMASHITALFLLPGFAFLIYVNLKNTKPLSFNKKYLPILLILLAVAGLIIQEIRLRYFIDIYTPSYSGGILPLFSLSEYSIFSPVHLYDILNQILLIAPICLLLLAYFIPGKKTNSDKRNLNIFLIIIIVSALLVISMIDPKLGYARDWDLLSIPTAVLGLSLCIFLLIGHNQQKVNKYTAFIIGSISILLLSGWILTNSSEKRQLERAEDLLSLSEKGQGYSTELLAHYYRYKKNDVQKALVLYQSITGRAKNARVYNKIAKAQNELGRYEDALKSANSGLELDSNLTDLQFMAGFILLKLNKPQFALPYLHKARELAPDRFEIYYFLSDAYYQLDSLGMSLITAREAIRLKPNFAPTYIEIGNTFNRLGVYDSAFVYTKKGLKLDPNNATGYELLEDIKGKLRRIGNE